jgi:predicted PurR-regulated permease PerM
MPEESEPGSAAPTARRYLSYPRAAGYVAVAVAVVVGCYALYMIREILFLFLVAVLLATAIEPLVLRLRRGPFSRGQGILIVYTAIMLVLAGVLAVTIPVLLAEAGSFSQTYPLALERVRGLVYGVDPQVLGPAAEQAVAKAAPSGEPADTGETALTVGVTVAEAAFAAVTVFMVAYYWLTERVEIKRAFLSVFPRARRVVIGTIWNEIEQVMGAWMRGQLLLMLFIGGACAIGYTLLGLRYALLLALIAGLLEVVPIVGPYLGAIPAILVALTQDVQTAVYVGLFTLVIQLVEGNVLVPRVMAQTVGVSSLTVVLGLLVGAALGGIPGALVAVPVAAAAQVLVKHLVMLDPEVAPEDAAAREAVVASAAANLSELPTKQRTR